MSLTPNVYPVGALPPQLQHDTLLYLLTPADNMAGACPIRKVSVCHSVFIITC
ncbi:MAG: hypothetical protein JWP79_3459 [Polaromonas sp.]|jgi:hypothetical protein|nr:hypothetical protein [Polaromonas sp.]MDB5846149.1 hypothetical protein [Polaromonas sp.]